MTLLLFVVYLALFIETITNNIQIGYLLVSSIALTLYCLITCFSKHESLTKFGKCIFVVSILGFVYSLCIVSGVNIMSLF